MVCLLLLLLLFACFSVPLSPALRSIMFCFVASISFAKSFCYCDCLVSSLRFVLGLLSFRSSLSCGLHRFLWMLIFFHCLSLICFFFSSFLLRLRESIRQVVQESMSRKGKTNISKRKEKTENTEASITKPRGTYTWQRSHICRASEHREETLRASE